MNTLIGIGNQFRSDDYLGLHVAREISKLRPEGLRVVEACGEGGELIELLRGRKRVFLVDAVSSGAEPGTIHRLSVASGRIPQRFFVHSSHAFGVGEAVAVSGNLGILPPEVRIYGIEGKSFAMGGDISPEVRERIPALIEEILRYHRHTLASAPLSLAGTR